MGEGTAISWADHTFNPWHGCTKVSPGCDRCYAETFSKRIGYSETGSKPAIWGKDAARRFFGTKHWAEPLGWDRAAEAARRQALVFCSSMADVFEPRDDLGEHRDRLWWTIEQTPHLIWLLLTKRPEWVPPMVAGRGWLKPYHWPQNVWIGTSVEDQQRADIRIPRLLNLPAPVRFLSCEPLLGPVDLAPWIDRVEQRTLDGTPSRVTYPSGIGWVIVGGESGPGHRPMDMDHAREIHRLCELAEIPFHFKQEGGLHGGGHLLEGELVQAFPALAGERGQAVAVRRG